MKPPKQEVIDLRNGVTVISSPDADDVSARICLSSKFISRIAIEYECPENRMALVSFYDIELADRTLVVMGKNKNPRYMVDLKQDAVIAAQAREIERLTRKIAELKGKQNL